MTGDRVLYFGFSVMFLSVLMFVIALLLIQPVTLNFEADVTGGVGDITTIATSGMESPIPLEFPNPLNGEQIKLNQNLNINSTMAKFNATAHLNGQIEIPAYMLAMAAHEKGDLMNFTVKGLNHP